MELHNDMKDGWIHLRMDGQDICMGLAGEAAFKSSSWLEEPALVVDPWL